MSSGFISETEIAEKRRTRQEEWEKVRQPHQPLEAPEEPHDPRSLYEKLQERKKEKDLEYEETHRLKHMIKGLDDDEVEFLDLVDRSKLEEERKKSAEEEREIADFRNKVATLQEQSIDERIEQEIRRPLKPPPNNTKTVSSGRVSQTKLLAGAVVKKRSADTKSSPKEEAKRAKTDIEENNINSGSTEKRVNSLTPVKTGSLTCIGILPGVGNYDISSEESDYSTDPEEDRRYDLLGRRVKKNYA